MMDAPHDLYRQFFSYSRTGDFFPLKATTEKLSRLGDWSEAEAGVLACRLQVPLPAQDGPFSLIPSLSLRVAAPYSFRFAADCQTARGRKMLTLEPVGHKEIGDGTVSGFTGVAQNDLHADLSIDFFDNIVAIHSLFLFVGGLALEDLDAIDYCAGMTVPGAFNTVSKTFTAPVLDVPAISQMEQDAAIASRICSPVSTTMVLNGFGVGARVDEVAPLSLSLVRDFYGVWPHSVWAASRHGVLGAVTALRSWEEVGGILNKGIPIVATLAYEAGELDGAAVVSTPGHLMTIKGLDSGVVVVNDPGAGSAAKVERRYGIGQFERAWFGRKQGVCYVFARPER